MSRIKKAMMAFVFFGIIGGCEANNGVPTNCGTSPTITYRDCKRCIVDVDGIGKNIILRNINGTVIQGTELFAYDNQYNNLIKLFISKNRNISTENDLCKEMLRFFLLDNADKLKNKYGISEIQNVDMFNQRNNIRALFLWHIAKHYTNCSTRKSGGDQHTVVLLDTKQSTYQAIKLGDLTLESNKVTALVNLLSDVINNCNFKFYGKSIVFSDTPVKIKDIKSLKDKKCTLYKVNKGTKAICFSELIKQNVEIANAFFRFKLNNFIDLGNFDINRYAKIDEDGYCGTFYMIEK